MNKYVNLSALSLLILAVYFVSPGYAAAAKMECYTSYNGTEAGNKFMACSMANYSCATMMMYKNDTLYSVMRGCTGADSDCPKDKAVDCTTKGDTTTCKTCCDTSKCNTKMDLKNDVTSGGVQLAGIYAVMISLCYLPIAFLLH